MKNMYEIKYSCRLDYGMSYGQPTFYDKIFVAAESIKEARLEAIDRIYKLHDICSHVTIIDVSPLVPTT